MGGNSQNPGKIANASRTDFRKDEGGFIDFSVVSGTLSSILKVIIVLTLLGATVGLLLTSIADIVTAVTTESTNNTTVDLLRPVFGLVIAAAGLFMIVRKVLEAAK
jgi:hypothetical protein